MCRKAKSDYYNEICNEIESLDKTHNPKLYQRVKQLRPRKLRPAEGVKIKHGQVLFDEKDILERSVQYIGELYSEKRPDICTDTNSILNTVNISEMEVREAITKLAKGKSTGVDEISAECFQDMGNKGIEVMTWIINTCYNTGFHPEDFLKSVFIQVPKVKYTKECTEHITIRLISHAAKILLQNPYKPHTRCEAENYELYMFMGIPVHAGKNLCKSVDSLVRLYLHERKLPNKAISLITKMSLIK